MRKEKHSYYAKEPGLLGTIWNLIYGLFLFIVFYGGFLAIAYAICIGLGVVILALFEAFANGVAIGNPYI